MILIKVNERGRLQEKFVEKFAKIKKMQNISLRILLVLLVRDEFKIVSNNVKN